MFVARMVQPAPTKKRSLTLDDDWLVMPLPDVVETIVPVPIVPGVITPEVVVVDVPPRGGNGHVSPAVTFDATPLAVTVELIPVARPLNSCAVSICEYPWAPAAKNTAAPIQKEMRFTFPLFIVYSFNSLGLRKPSCKLALSNNYSNSRT
jgi:hypothetical protein